jgi:hypothetical protein
MDNNVLFLFAAILIVAGLLLAMIVFTKGGGKSLNQDKFRSRWLSIESSLKKDQEASFMLSIINADKLVDQALRELGVKGKTMGDRMKNSSDKFSNKNSIWSAHKLRNQIAHEHDVQVSYDSARRALASFKQALKDLGAI